jgi:hypothetical protein
MKRNKLSPPQLALLYGVSPAKIGAWIRSGELRAINAATRPGGRPRYLVDLADLAAFKAGRAIQPPTQTSSRPRRKKPTSVIEFF